MTNLTAPISTPMLKKQTINIKPTFNFIRLATMKILQILDLRKASR